ncbi:hypothetical protein LCGC14_3144070 [marine sediment metagenome]|uniref:Uncharacterized protein n=1 Tax=marine sediment metagenome TaxID=412755 RepID=A0A0F8YKD0_9ZZZZ
MSYKVEHARKVMRKVFEKDPDFKRVYIQNIESLLDMHGFYSEDNVFSGNHIAGEIIDLVFGEGE